jgi:hypothetical protein
MFSRSARRETESRPPFGGLEKNPLPAAPDILVRPSADSGMSSRFARRDTDSRSARGVSPALRRTRELSSRSARADSRFARSDSLHFIPPRFAPRTHPISPYHTTYPTSPPPSSASPHPDSATNSTDAPDSATVHTAYCIYGSLHDLEYGTCALLLFPGARHLVSTSGAKRSKG